MKAGTALRLLCLPFTLVMLAGCDRQASSSSTPSLNKMDAAQEAFEDVQATKNNPSLQPGSNEAGPPIHVNPYPKSAGMKHDEYAHHHMPMH